MAACIMVQGTMSGAGKSLLVTALCRIFKQDGFRVAPFKSQNMALNSYITKDGLEMGRAQVAQAEAAGEEPDIRMNPILLKPTSHVGSQVVLNGEVLGQYSAAEYFRMKKDLVGDIVKAYQSLAKEYDIIVLEGAGSPAEINLKQEDIVNMGMAKLVDAPVLLVGDIDRGGVFAQLYGTIALLEPEERSRIIGTVINKFRGDEQILKPGLAMLEDKTKLPVVGVIPYAAVDIDSEDSLAPCLTVSTHHKPIDIAIIRFPHISNFTDFAPLESHSAMGVRYVTQPEQLGTPDMILLPGSKNTMADLLWMRQHGLEAAILKKADDKIPIMGICGGYQMLGEMLQDPEHMEEGGQMRGMGLLPCQTVFTSEKRRTRVTAEVSAPPFQGVLLEGYEIHMGKTTTTAPSFSTLSDQSSDGAVSGNIFGTYLHGLFDNGSLTTALATWLCEKKGLVLQDEMVETHTSYKERQYNILADVVREHIDLSCIYEAMGVMPSREHRCEE